MSTLRRVTTAAFVLGLALPQADAQFGGSFGGGPQSTSVTTPIAIAQPTSDTAKLALESLDSMIEFGSIDTKLGDLDNVLATALDGVPVFLDHRAIKLAELSSETKITATLAKMPMRSAFRRLLQPHSLRVVVDEEGFVITADFAELARCGIATDRWIRSNHGFSERVEKALNEPTTVMFVDTPLEEAVAQLSELSGLPIIIDSNALDEIGLAPDIAVNLNLKSISLRSILHLLLKDLDLTYMTSHEVLTVTTIEEAERNLQLRIYWLEGLGFPIGDFDHVVQSIQTSIEPETWEALGGPSTMSPLTTGTRNRPALAISTTNSVHQRIEALFETLRDAHVGPDPIAKSSSAIEKAKKPSPPVGGVF